MPSPIRRGLGAVAAIAADVRYGRVGGTIHAGGAPYMRAADGVKKQATAKAPDPLTHPTQKLTWSLTIFLSSRFSVVLDMWGPAIMLAAGIKHLYLHPGAV